MDRSDDDGLGSQQAASETAYDYNADPEIATTTTCARCAAEVPCWPRGQDEYYCARCGEIIDLEYRLEQAEMALEYARVDLADARGRQLADRARIDELLAHSTALREENRQRIRTRVAQFHRIFGQPILHEPRVPPEARVRLRLRLITEEYRELYDALLDTSVKDRDGHLMTEAFEVDAAFGTILVGIEDLPIRVDLVAAADALADLDYIVEGSRLEFGIDGESIACEVHRSNIAKARCRGCGLPGVVEGICPGCGGTTYDVVVREDGKIEKPKGWKPPEIDGCLYAQGWRKP